MRDIKEVWDELAEHINSMTREDSMKCIRWSDDLVEIVRCKDCIKRGTDKCKMRREVLECDEDMTPELIIRDWTEDDGFCHCGTR